MFSYYNSISVSKTILCTSKAWTSRNYVIVYGGISMKLVIDFMYLVSKFNIPLKFFTGQTSF